MSRERSRCDMSASGLPVEKQRGELRDHRATDVLLGHERAIHELTTVQPVFHDAALLESRQQRRDRRLREIALRPEAGLDLDHGGFRAIPENAHDRQLEVGE